MGDGESRKFDPGLPIGSRIGKYVICEKLGSGGQAVVYKCHDKLLDRYVAIKQISGELPEDPQFIERFRREAQILARLGAEQPAIISIYELIEEVAGLFIVMEFAEGRSLESILDDTDEPVDPKAALQIIWRLAAGLSVVHEAGIIHRDIKPSNIIVSEDLKVKITDFGVAALALEEISTLLGTTKYMAPEIFGGGRFDARADMYSLGFIAYEMLTGRTGFNEIFADVLRDQHGEKLGWVRWHGNAEIEAPPLSEVNPDVPGGLSEIVEKMMAKNPEERFQSMEMLGRAIKLRFSPPGMGTPPPQKTVPITSAVAPSGETPPPINTPDNQLHQSDAPPTPPPAAPRGKILSLRGKLILAGLGAVCLMTAGIVLGIQQAYSRKALIRNAESFYADGYEAYRSANYDLAVEKFAEVNRRFAGTSQAYRASVMIHLGRAQLARDLGDWATAETEQDTANARVKQIQARDDYLEEWTSDVLGEIARFDRHLGSTRRFTEAMAEARAALADGNFNEIRAILDKQLRSVKLSEEQEKRLREFLQEVARKKILTEVDLALAAGAKLTGDGKLAEAISAYAKARKKLDSKDADVLLPEQRTSLSERVTSRLREAQTRVNHQQVMVEVQTAKRGNDKQSELSALEKAVALIPSQIHEARIHRLRSDITLEQARLLLTDNKTKPARAMIAQALKHDPNNTAAKVELKTLDDFARWRELVGEADVHFDTAQYSEALTKYTQADHIRSDPVVSARIVECRFVVDFAAADALRDAKKYEEALAAYERLRTVKPDEGEKIDSREADLRRRETHDGEIKMGDVAMVRKEWATALRHYRTARTLRPTEEVEERIKTARYSENLTKGKAAMSDGDLRSARAYFKTARRYRQTKEIDDLIEQVEKKLEEQ